MAEALDPALPSATDRLARQVLEKACDQELKLVTAESCTGGLLASLLTDIPGCSHAFERGFVTYTDEAKNELLEVPMEVLERDGAVSERAARAMAEGALAHSRGDVALAITGFTESGPSPGQPGGLVHFAAARHNRPTRHRVMRFGEIGRAEVRLKALDVALSMMLAQMAETADAV